MMMMMMMDRIDREHDGVIHVNDLVLFFGETIPVTFILAYLLITSVVRLKASFMQPSVNSVKN